MLSGRFDFHTRKLFPVALKKAQATNPKEIVLNFADVLFIDSAGLGLLMLAKKDLQDPTCQLTLAIPQGYVMEVMNLASMAKQIPIIETEQ